MKKLLFGLTAAVFALAFATPTLADTGSMGISTSTPSVQVGSQATVSVSVSSDVLITAVEAVIDYDATKLSYVSASFGSDWNPGLSSCTNISGQADCTGGANASFTASNSNLVTITFNTLAEGSASVTINNASLVLRTSDGTDILGHPVSGGVAINITAQAQPTDTPIPGQPTNTPTVAGLASVGPSETVMISLVAAAVLALGAVLVLRTRKVTK